MKIKNIIAIVVGIIASMIIIIIGEALVHIANPLPTTIDINDTEALKAHVANSPFSLHLLILLNYALACFVGGLIASSIAIDKKMNQAMTLGGIFMGVGMFSLITLHPLWVVICSVFIFLPFAYMGGMMSLKMSEKKK